MNKESISNRVLKALETKKKIYESAEQLFREHGFVNVTIDAIVARARVSKGSFYVHFVSKDALIATLMADFVQKLDLDYKSYLASFPAGTMASDMVYTLSRLKFKR